ncbi:phosphatase PAP2 family protein, partial [Kitasatospora sp. RB6PN24]|uniref:phosphatase PAP2 family protein n=1 Tax=Kitasatospora humi TaxID=2893891 RepID=UPI001E29CE55
PVGASSRSGAARYPLSRHYSSVERRTALQNLTLSWQSAGTAGAVLLGAAYAVHRARPARTTLVAVLREAGTLLALFALWQLVGRFSLMSTDHALDRAEWIHRTELKLGLPDEASWQQAMMSHSVLLRLANYYYAVMHFGVMIAMLLWLFLRHRDRYPWVRNTVVLVTASCLLIQFVPVAPPRMLTDQGFVDVAAQYGQSVYTAGLGGVHADELSAMPSVHVAWCVLVAVAVIAVSESAWRWLVLVHPLLTIAVVVVTANHFWADGIVALWLLLLAYAAQYAAGRRRRRSPARAWQGAPETQRVAR